MTLPRWNPPVGLTKREKLILKHFKRTRKLYVFLREHRHELIDDELREKIEEAYRDTGAGKEPNPPEMMVAASIMQAYEGVSDARAVQLSAVDKVWQLVLGTLGTDDPAFSQGALFEFRQKLIANDLDKRILERTAKIARSTKGFDAKRLPKTLRIAVDSSGLEGAGRVEDTINLIGHAARKVVECAAKLLEVEFDHVCRQAGIPLLLDTSVKKALDRDWSDAAQKVEAVDIVARQALSLERWLDKHLVDEVKQPPLDSLLDVLRELMEQDLEPDPNGNRMQIIDGVAQDRRISIEDGDMRHGRKSKTKRIDGYKRHVATDLDRQAIMAVAVTPANHPEQEALALLQADIEAQDLKIGEAHFDRAYMGSPVVQQILDGGGTIICKPWKTNNGDLFAKHDFSIDIRAKSIKCPSGITVPIEYGRPAKFPAVTCDGCALRSQCTTAAKGNGRTVSIAESEPLQQRLRKLGKTKAGRELFRQRVPVEHSLAHIGYRQGNRARYLGTRKNEFDLRRAAIIQNLETVQRKEAA